MVRAGMFIIFLVVAIGPYLASASLQREKKWIRLPIPIPRPSPPAPAAGAGAETPAACPTLVGCIEAVEAMTPKCDSGMCPVNAGPLTRKTCYWPTTPTNNCVKMTGTGAPPDCACGTLAS